DKHLEGVGEEVVAITPEEKKKRSKLIRMSLLVLGISGLIITLIFLGVISIDAIGLAAVSNNVIAIVALLYFAYLIFLGGLDTDEKKKVGVIAILFLFSAMFWSGFEQAGSSINLFADRFTDRTILGWQIPTGYFQSITSLFIIIFAPIFGAMSIWLGRPNL